MGSFKAPSMNYRASPKSESISIFSEAFARLKKQAYAVVAARQGLQRDDLAMRSAIVTARNWNSISGSNRARHSFAIPPCEKPSHGPFFGAKRGLERRLCGALCFCPEDSRNRASRKVS
jgi:hypothetical protein